MSICLNIACGDSYLPGWLNFDYVPHSMHVKKVDLLKRLPLPDNCADVVYSSHFFEHIPRPLVSLFVAECFRICKPGGKIRLVMPDFEELCTAYLSYRSANDHVYADFLMLEILDQCVRTRPGGELGDFYNALEQTNPDHSELISFIRQRTGHQINPSLAERKKIHVSDYITGVKRKIEQYYIKMVLTLLPKAFRRQNVSLASVGERHAWLYDFHSVKEILIQAGFTSVQKMSAYTSNIPDFPFKPLDLNEDGSIRKGSESMYIEAQKR